MCICGTVTVAEEVGGTGGAGREGWENVKTALMNEIVKNLCCLLTEKNL